MSATFRNKRKLDEQILGLGFLMSCCVQQAPNSKKQIAAVENVKNIDIFLWKCQLREVTIDNSAEFHYSSGLARELVGASDFPFILDKETLIRIWSSLTDKFQQEHWVRLKMSIAIYTRLNYPGLREQADLISSASSDDFRRRLNQDDAELEQRLDDPNYQQQLIRDLGNFNG